MPHPPSPTTTNFFEYDGGCVIFVASDILPVDMLVVVLTVPLLVRVLWLLVGFRFVEIDTEGVFSLMTDGWRFM